MRGRCDRHVPAEYTETLDSKPWATVSTTETQFHPEAADDLDGVNQMRIYPDGSVVRVFCTRTTAVAYLSGWAYSLHYGALEPDPPRTLDDGTIRRYDNAHEDTKGDELHVAPKSEPEQIDFPGIIALWQRFWSEIPKSEIDIE